MLNADKRVLKIADFGIARILTEESTMSEKGSKKYMAPEVGTKLKYGLKSDIWLALFSFRKSFSQVLFRFLIFYISKTKRSLGIIFYEMVTYKVPFLYQEHTKEKELPELPPKYKEFNNLFKKYCDSF